MKLENVIKFLLGLGLTLTTAGEILRQYDENIIKGGSKKGTNDQGPQVKD